ncbi:hypothetical protein KP509_30G008500 [Ceratopteris richardii]|uniref:CREG-like beta-barrel domain-containing protein n=1 Tax=Ceratopteris richardii TaxID=49495 RepID=A0A8T2R1N9_CERRI|nr:hypothetical protein KP509_30G008500 [Ceratopteris richardii]
MVKHYALPMWAMILVILWVTTTAAEKTRPDPNDPHRMARWLVASSYWAVISTTSIHLKGAPWGNVADVSDGDPINSTGVPYFYLTSLDPTPQDLAANPNCSVTFSEDALGTCAEFDAEDPRCAKLTLYGQVGQMIINSMSTSLISKIFFLLTTLVDQRSSMSLNIFKRSNN